MTVRDVARWAEPEGSPRDAVPRRVVFFMAPGFSMMALSSAIEPLRAVNRLAAARRYEWLFVAADAGETAASNGIVVKTAPLSKAGRSDMTVVVASLDAEGFRDARALSWLRGRRNGPASLCAISNGALILARAGALDGRRATLHWEAHPVMRALYPAVDLVDALYCVDGDVATAAGGVAAMDLMLSLVAERDGRAMAADVAEQFLHGPLRESAERQRSDVRWRYGLTDALVVHAITIMEAAIEHPLRTGVIADRLAISERQLARRFESALGQTPSDLYLELRLAHARRRLVGSDESLEAIAEQAGFSSLGHFSRAFKSWTGEPPSNLRRRARAAAAAPR
jgi:transcriptional regulator GlxA family with amidase domain